MRKGSRGDKVVRFLGIALPIAIVLPLIAAFHWGQLGWRDQHANYPTARLPAGSGRLLTMC